MNQKVQVIKKIVCFISSSKNEPSIFHEIKSGYWLLGNVERIDCLKESQRILLSQSEDNIIDAHLSKFVRLFDSLSYEYSEVDRLLEKYVLFNMENYKGLETIDRIPRYFREICEACVSLKDLRLFRIIIEDAVFWQNEWCSLDEDKTDETKIDIDEKYKIIKTAIRHSRKIVELYDIIDSAQKNICGNFIVNMRLQYLLFSINANLTCNDAEKLYEKYGEAIHLFQTKNIDYIEKEFMGRNFELAKSPNIDLKKISDIMHSLVDRRAISFYYLNAVPMFPIGDVDSLLLIEDIKSYPDLLDELVRNVYWINNQSSLTKWIKLLPEDYWTDDYKKFLKDQFELVFAKKYAVSPYYIIDKNGIFYYGLKNASLKKWKSEFFHKELSSYPSTLVTEMSMEYVNASFANILRNDKSSISIWEKHLLPNVNVIVSEFSNDTWHFVVEHDTQMTIKSLIEIDGKLYKKRLREQHVCIKCNHQIDCRICIYPKNKSMYYKKIANYQNYFTEMELKELFQ